MPLSIARLRSAGPQWRTRTKVASSVADAQARSIRTAFLCHSHKDRDLVEGLLNELADSGWSVYVDWIDAGMPETPDATTAQRIKQKIQELNLFLFLATPNSTSSRWCPWEIGFADGKKANDTIFIIPTSDGRGCYGNEYLQLYRRIDDSQQGPLGVWAPGQTQGYLLRNA